jgi:hypothetical protein
MTKPALQKILNVILYTEEKDKCSKKHGENES